MVAESRSQEKAATHESTTSRLLTKGLWLSGACGLDTLISDSEDSDHGCEQDLMESVEAEVTRYLRYKGDIGDLDDPLSWWKVVVSLCLSSLSLTFIPDRNMRDPFL